MSAATLSGTSLTAAQQQFEAAANSRRVGGADHRNLQLTGEEAVVRLEAVAIERRAFAEGLQIHARAERAVSGSGQHQHADIGIALGRGRRVPDLVQQRRRQRVPRLRAIQSRDQHRPLPVEYELGFGVAHELS